MNERIDLVRERIDALETKERFLVLAALILVLGAVWHSVLIQPLEVERKRLQREATRTQNQLTELDLEAVRIVEAARRDPNEPLRRQIEAAVAQTRTFEDEVRDRAGQLIDPKDMARVLQSVLEQTQGMKFVSLEGLGAQPLLRKGKAANQKSNGARTAYRHGFRIRFVGSYLKTIDYLHALEALPWRFFWDAVEIDVKDHPEAEGSIVVYTLSLDRSWIDV